MSDGHSDAETGEERDRDFGGMTDDGEVELNFPREDATERDPPGEDVPDSPGATASGTSVTKQDELYRLEPPNEARPKWTRQGRPIPLIKDPRSPGAGATVVVDVPETNGGGMSVLAPTLPPLRQDRQSAGMATPTQVDTDRLGGFRGPEGRLPGKETWLASQVFADSRDRDVISDRRDLPWSPENVLMDTVVRLQRDLNYMRAESRYLRTSGVRDAVRPVEHVTFTSTKVPRFAGATSWERRHCTFKWIGRCDCCAAVALSF